MMKQDVIHANAQRRASGTRGRTLRAIYSLLACLLWLAAIGDSYGACSAAYHGRATINEVHRQGNATRFVEVKLLDTSITSANWSGWSLRLCPPSPGSCSGWISLSNATDNTPWLVIDKPYITSQNFINLSSGTSVRLRDAAGDTIDWLSIAGNTRLQDASCAPAYDGTMTGTISQTIERFPDGTGDWRDTGGGASGGDTTGGTNDQAPDGTPAPTVSVTSVTVQKGDTATLTLSLASAVGYDISVSYDTQDDSAVAGTDYTAASGTATIPTGSTSATINIDTTAASSSGEVSFNVYLHDPVNGTLANHFPTVTILAGPLAYWRMDEAAWSSAAGQVEDQSGNGYHGTAVNGPATDTTTPALTGSPGTCGYGVFDGNNDYVALPAGFPNLTGSFTITAWIRADRIDKDQRIFADDHNNTGGYAFSLGDNANGQLRFFSRNVSPVSLDSPTVIAAGTWYFVAAVHDATSKTRRIYVASVAGTPAQVVQGTYTGTWGSDSGAAGIGGENNGASGSEGSSNWRFDGNIDEVRVYNNALDAAALAIVKQASHPCSGASIDHFVVGHDGMGINCMLEPVSVTAMLVDGVTTDTTYTGTITLDTQAGAGTWTLATGNGTFTDATAGDGLATYQFVAADNGTASFNLDYQSGIGSIDVDVYDGAIRDDDSEPNLLFSPSGFTVTAGVLTNPPSLPIDLSIPAQTAASDFNLHLTAYGQTPTDATCGVIESYDGVQSVGFWSTYMNPVTGAQAMTVDGTAIATSQAARVAQNITFAQGQAQITVNYADVGSMALAMRDDSTGNPDLPTGIFGTSQSFVVKPAGFVLSNIRRTSDAFPNSGTAVDESGAAFMAAGDNFSVTVTAVNALGNTTPNYGQESTPESVSLTSTLVAAGAANNPAVGFTTGFASFINGVATGTDFHWDEVGIITLTPQVAPTAAETTAGNPGSYLGAGDVVGTVSSNVGRFYPDHFVTTKTDGSFANACTTFNYLGQSFGYLGMGNPTVKATAVNLAGATTANYTGVWARLGTAGVSLTYPTADNTQLDEGGLALIAVTSTPGSLARADNSDGSLTFTLGGAGADSFAYVRDAAQVMPFTSDLTIELTAVDDGEASAADLSPPKTITPIGNAQRFGRGYAQDVHGTMSQTGDSLSMPIGSWFYNAAGVWQLNTDDSCSSYAYTKTDAGIATTIPVASASPLTLTGGVGSLTLSVSADAGSPGGTSVVNTVWPSWLQYDVDGIDQLLDGNSYDDDFSATATFGIFRGDDRYLYWREAP
ncbi:MAG: LamG-like jellyroll fold domain-containing protein [Gammaproteobacteria bacterium]|nr:LamG-like jellyroll fold domain-containing protein [Gammaproteobacteria bacterium]